MAIAPLRLPMTPRFAGKQADNKANGNLKSDKTPLDKATFVSIDTETTGFKPSDNHLVQVSAVRYQNGEPTGDEYTALVKPPKGVRWEEGDYADAFEVHGITTEQGQKEGKPLGKVLTELSDFVGESPKLVGQNINFDLSHIKTRMADENMQARQNRFSLNNALDTRTIGKQAYYDIDDEKVFGGSLKDLTARLGITNDRAHDAKNDAMATAEVLYALVDKLNDSCDGTPIQTVGDLRRYQGPVQTWYRWNPDTKKRVCPPDTDNK